MLPQIQDLLAFDIQSLLGGKGQLLGLDIGSSSIKLVQLKETKSGYVLEKFGVKPLEPEVIVDGTVMDESRVVGAITELLEEHDVKLKKVAISISGHSVIVKKISLPPMPDDELDSQVKLAAEQYIPFDINEVNFDFHVLSTNQQGDDGEQEMALLLVAAKKDKINELSEIVKGSGLVPTVLDVDAFAIENMYSLIQGEATEEVIALLNVGASVMNVNIIKGGTSVFTRDIPIGGNRYTEAIQREMGMTYEEAESTKKKIPPGEVIEEPLSSVIEGVNSEIASEIARTIDYFKSTGSDEEVQQVVLCGGGAKVAGLAQTLSDRMGIQVEIANPFGELDTTLLEYDGDTLQDLASEAGVGIGLALRTVGDR